MTNISIRTKNHNKRLRIECSKTPDSDNRQEGFSSRQEGVSRYGQFTMSCLTLMKYETCNGIFTTQSHTMTTWHASIWHSNSFERTISYSFERRIFFFLEIQFQKYEGVDARSSIFSINHNTPSFCLDAGRLNFCISFWAYSSLCIYSIWVFMDHMASASRLFVIYLVMTKLVVQITSVFLYCYLSLIWYTCYYLSCSLVLRSSSLYV